ncbi:MAG: DUF6029 family protein [Bacteroidales bacterium]|nr:DUF6029 family protein [Bacteroidales bacterium]
MKIFTKIAAGLLLVLPLTINAQDDNGGFNPISGGNVRGNVQLDAQYYPDDKGLGINDSTLNGKRFGLNTYSNIIYNYKNFSAGMRFEAFLNPMQGYDARYEGVGIPYWFASFKNDKLEMTAGHFYEQFGSGLIFRTYEEWTLGYDNNMLGVDAKFRPYDGITITGVAGVQRYFWQKYSTNDRGIVKGLDANLAINDIIYGEERAASQKVRFTLGGSFISRYMDCEDQRISSTSDTLTIIDPITGSPIPATMDVAVTGVIPRNVGAWASRFGISGGGVDWYVEYAQKANDPSGMNHYIYKKGQAFYSTLSYSTKGVGIYAAYKWIDNMSFKSDPNQIGTPSMLDINYLPAITKEHVYSLATMYPYATQPNGEAGLQVQAMYTIPRRTKIGGKYGTTITANYSLAKDIKKEYDTESPNANEYTAKLFSMGDLTFYQDINIQLERKFSKKFKMKLSYYNQNYNQHVVEDNIYDKGAVVLANIGVADLTYNISTNTSLRFELQGLWTSSKDKYVHDDGDWLSGLLELNIAPKWFVSVGDEWNYKTYNEDKDPLHYFNVAFGYTQGANRISLRYGRQRDGLLCVGGVCRYVPQSTGLTLSILSSF